MGQTLTRAGLQRRLVETCGLSAGEAERLVARVIEMVGEALASGETVKLTGFGTLGVRGRAPRQGRNPRTGQSYPVGARRVVVFTPGLKLRSQLDGLGDAGNGLDRQGVDD